MTSSLIHIAIFGLPSRSHRDSHGSRNSIFPTRCVTHHSSCDFQAAIPQHSTLLNTQLKFTLFALERQLMGDRSVVVHAAGGVHGDQPRQNQSISLARWKRLSGGTCLNCAIALAPVFLRVSATSMPQRVTTFTACGQPSRGPCRMLT